jgi:hypothetical protein
MRPPFSQFYREGDFIMVRLDAADARTLNEGNELSIGPSRVEDRIPAETPEFLRPKSKRRGGCWPYW